MAGSGPGAFPLPRVLTHPSAAAASPGPQLITQGAEGRLYKTTFLDPGTPAALKFRPSKPYRHPALDARLTRQRILAEARTLHRCRRDGGLAVPAVYAADEAAGWLMMEWIEGAPVRVRLNEWLARTPADESIDAADPALLGVMRRVGEAVGRMHGVGIVHGDLTTSNLMLRPWREGEPDGHAPAAAAAAAAGGQGSQEEEEAAGGLLDGDIVVIDFGLATQSSSDEDRAVDLYVLERAFGSTHPRAEPLFSEVLVAYKETFQQAGPVLRKLEAVRMRGRKRSMVG